MIGSIRITDMYMSVLSSLSNDEKLDLIARLSASMRKKKAVSKKKSMEVFACFHEDWGGNESPKKIAEELRKGRVFTRNMEEW